MFFDIIIDPQLRTCHTQVCAKDFNFCAQNGKSSQYEDNVAALLVIPNSPDRLKSWRSSQYKDNVAALLVIPNSLILID